MSQQYDPASGWRLSRKTCWQPCFYGQPSKDRDDRAASSTNTTVSTVCAYASRVTSISIPDHAAHTLLYIHALESIFGFLSLHDLHSVATVTKRWNAAVGSAKSIGATISEEQMRKLAKRGTPRLSHHVTQGAITESDFHMPLNLTRKSLQRVSLVTPQLVILDINLREYWDERHIVLPWYLPRHLIHFTITTELTHTVGYLFQHVCRQLSNLQTFHLEMLTCDIPISTLDFRALADTATSLTELYVEFPELHNGVILENGQMTQMQVDDIRAMVNLVKFPCSMQHNPILATQLLQQPQDHWTSIAHNDSLVDSVITEANVLLLINMPSLTKLMFRLDVAPWNRNPLVLMQLTHLTDLTVRTESSDHETGTRMTSLMKTVPYLQQLTKLCCINCTSLTSERLTQLLSNNQLSRLQSLELIYCWHMISFVFLHHDPPLTSLSRLYISSSRSELLSANEANHLLSLPNLTNLTLNFPSPNQQALFDKHAWEQVHTHLHQQPFMHLLHGHDPFKTHEMLATL